MLIVKKEIFMKKSVLLSCLFILFFSRIFADSGNYPNPKISFVGITFILLLLIVLVIIRLYKNKSADYKVEHAIEVSNRLKLRYFDKCRLLVTNFQNTKDGIHDRILRAVEMSNIKLGYEYPHDIEHDLRALSRKIKEVNDLSQDEVKQSPLEIISTIYYSLQTLMISYTNVARNIDIITNKIMVKRRDYDELVNKLQELFIILNTTYKKRHPMLNEHTYKELIELKDKKESKYDAALSLLMHYESLISRYSSKPDTNRSSNSALTSKI